MSYLDAGDDERQLYVVPPGGLNSALFYGEKRHIRSLLRHLGTACVVLFVSVFVVIAFSNMGRIFNHWIDTSPTSNYVAGNFRDARSRWNEWVAQFGDLSWIGTLVTVIWAVILVYLFASAFYNFSHAYRKISTDYVVDSEKVLLRKEQSLTLESVFVVGATVRRTFIDKFFPNCGSVIVQTIDLEGQGKKILLRDVKDPYRMRDVILNVKRYVRENEGK